MSGIESKGPETQQLSEGNKQVEQETHAVTTHIDGMFNKAEQGKQVPQSVVKELSKLSNGNDEAKMIAGKLDDGIKTAVNKSSEGIDFSKIG